MKTKTDKYQVLDIISEVIEKKHKVDDQYIFQDTRKREVCDLRKVFFYLATRFTNLPLQDIGNYSKHRGRGSAHNHATIIYSSKLVKDWISIDKEYKEYIGEIENEVKYFVDYEQYRHDESNKYKKKIAQKIYHEEDIVFLTKYSEITEKLYKNREFIDNLADTINELITNKEQNNERVYQASQEDSRLGMVQGLQY